jgi:hypothetical protein
MGEFRQRVLACQGLIQKARLLGNLANYLKLEDVKNIVAKTGNEIVTIKPGETFIPPTVLQLDAGWLSKEKSRIAILVCLQAHKDIQAAKLQARDDTASHCTRQNEIQLQPGSAVLVFQGARFRITPAGIPFLVILVETSPIATVSVQAEAA